jgi:hypothetical protein
MRALAIQPPIESLDEVTLDNQPRTPILRQS